LLAHRQVAVAALVLGGLMAAAGPAEAGNVSKLALECHAGKQKACDELAKIALTDKHDYAREEAAGAVRDQTVLAKIALEDPEKDVRDAAVRNLTDEAALEKVAIADKDKEVSKDAAHKLQDPAAIFRVALNAASQFTRSLATAMLKDQGLLARLAIENTNASIRRDALQDITDETSLKTVATTSKDPAIQTAAVWKLQDQATLQSLANSAGDETVRKAALAALDVRTASQEREVYLWKAASTPANRAPQQRWKIDAAVGAADLSGGFVDTSSSTNTMAGVALGAATLLASAGGFNDAPDSVSWDFRPESAQDVCVLEAGQLEVGDFQNSRHLDAPISFTAQVRNDKGSWVVSNGEVAFVLQPHIHTLQNGTLTITGAWAAFGVIAGSPAHAVVRTQTMSGAIATVTGKIRFPEDRWTLAGAGIEIMGGGLQFDETGVFLMVGTKYRKHPQ